MKKTYYHAVTMDKMKSIMRHGLIKNISDNGVYFTDDAISSLDWIRYREKLWFKNEHKSLGLVIFEVDTDDENILPYKDNVTSQNPGYPKKWIEAQKKSECIIYQKSIHPSFLKFEECFVDGDDYDCFELVNNQKYVAPTKKMRIDLMLKSLKSMCGYNLSTNEYIILPKTAYKQIDGNPIIAEYYYDNLIKYWKEHPKETKPFGKIFEAV